MRIRFISGLDHIGGIQLVIETADALVVTDLGLGETEDAALLNRWAGTSQRHDARLLELMLAGMAPAIPGLFRGGDRALAVVEALPSSQMRPPVIDPGDRQLVVALSHAHGDHTGLVHDLAEDVVIHTSEMTARMLSAVSRARQHALPAAGFVEYSSGDSAQVGETVIEFHAVDHDVAGAMAVIVREGDAAVAFMGDWRLHGTRPDLMRAFADHCRETAVPVLVSESTTVSGSVDSRWPWDGLPTASMARDNALQPLSEETACRRVGSEIRTAAGAVFVCFHPQHTERLAAIDQAVSASGRRLLLTERTYRLVTEMAREGIVSMTSDIQQLPDTLDGVQELAREFSEHRSTFAMELGSASYRYLLHLGADSRDLMLHAGGHPLGSSYPGWQTLEEWRRWTGMHLRIIDSHGHATPAALREIWARANPKQVVPVHGPRPDVAAALAPRAFLPTRFESYEVSADGLV